MGLHLTGTPFGSLHAKSVSLNPDLATLLLPRLGKDGNLADSADLAEPHARHSLANVLRPFAQHGKDEAQDRMPLYVSSESGPIYHFHRVPHLLLFIFINIPILICIYQIPNQSHPATSIPLFSTSN